MDLRIRRTKQNITHAFIELRAKKETEKITVKELAELAFINKATFYQHYKDIYDLSDQLEKESIANVVNSITHPEYFLDNPREFFREISTIMREQAPIFDILFTGTRKYRMVELLEKELKQLIHTRYPEVKDNLRQNIMLSVAIHGIYATAIQYRTDHSEEAMDYLSDISELLVQHFYE